MRRLVAFAAIVLLTVLAVLSPLARGLDRDAVVPLAVVPLAVAALHGLGMMGLARWTLTRGQPRPVVPHPADYITIGRAMIGSGCLGVVVAAAAGSISVPSWWIAAPAALALALDAVDGPVARRTQTASPAGGRFDLECDAVFALVLALAAALIYGPWVLVLGLMRYAFVLAGLVVPRLRGALVFSRLRRVVAGAQGVVLVVAVTPLLPYAVDLALLVGVLVLVVGSFGRDVVGLLRTPAAAVG